MKAKEYAARYKQSPTNERLVEIARAFALEVQTIADARHAKSDAAWRAILDEQDRKWRVFASMVEHVHPDGYMLMIEHVLPEIYWMWKGKGRGG